MIGMTSASRAHERLCERRYRLAEFTLRLAEALDEAREQRPPLDQTMVIRGVLQKLGLTDADL